MPTVQNFWEHLLTAPEGQGQVVQIEMRLLKRATFPAGPASRSCGGHHGPLSGAERPSAHGPGAFALPASGIYAARDRDNLPNNLAPGRVREVPGLIVRRTRGGAASPGHLCWQPSQ